MQEKDLKLAKSRIKLGLLLNEYGEKNNIKVTDEEVRAEIQKQIKGMPGQEKMVLEYYQKNPSASKISFLKVKSSLTADQQPKRPTRG